MPYLRIFDPEEGSREIELTQDRTHIGREVDDGILLDHPTVSRIHAVIHREKGQHVIEDANSRAGTFVNGERLGKTVLKHRDTVIISLFVLEYRTDDAVRRASLVRKGDTAMDRMMRMNFRRLPSEMRLRYRTVNCDPELLFEAGDTLRVGDGGILVPASNPVAEHVCIEVELTWPNGKAKTVMGEVQAILPGKRMALMCIKLHNLEPGRYQRVLVDSKRGSWTTAPPERG